MVQGRKTSLRIHLTLADRQTLLAWQREGTIPAGQRRRGRTSSSSLMGCRLPRLPARSDSSLQDLQVGRSVSQGRDRGPG